MPVVPFMQYLLKLLDRQLTPPHLQHGAHQPSYHTPQKPVGDDLVHQTIIFNDPPALPDGANKCLHLGIPLGKRGKIGMTENDGCRSLQLLPVQPVGKEISPVIKEWVLFAIDIVPVLPAERVKSAMVLLPYGKNILQHDIPGKDGIDVI